ncbi:photosystem I assembly factor PSA3, chloroplastic [Gastrolobium bilobum]|uniref:photosystem I assembly factor PSA3, chloroplastic n=1 Tax=Gastrolobium bilobum TaxID=150636 RepID=UPI002AB26ACE|nr:photosystem I assembly factor PSA3, chloroplastic [Gastrolobium bilobum]
MVVLKSISPLSSLQTNLTTHFFNLSSSSKLTSSSSSSSLLFLGHHVHPTRRPFTTSKVASFTVRAYMENQNSLSAGDPLYVLLCCWLAALGAGLLKTEEILKGVARLRISNDIEFEEQTFMALMNEARERRAKINAAPPAIPMETRVEKALDAFYVCCFGKDPIEEEDERLLSSMLSAVFPSVKPQEIKRLVKDKAEKVAEGVNDDYVTEAKPLSKEAVEMQMNDLKFLRQNSET